MMTDNEKQAIEQANELLARAGLPTYDTLREVIVGLDEYSVFDHADEDSSEEADLKLRAREAAHELGGADLGDIDHVDSKNIYVKLTP